MANARAVIATNVGGVADLLGEVRDNREYSVCERGIGVRPGDVDGFASGLALLVDDQELRSGVATRGFEFVRQRYPKQRLFDDIRGLYDELLNPEPGAFRQVSQVRSKAL